MGRDGLHAQLEQLLPGLATLQPHGALLRHLGSSLHSRRGLIERAVLPHTRSTDAHARTSVDQPAISARSRKGTHLGSVVRRGSFSKLPSPRSAAAAISDAVMERRVRGKRVGEFTGLGVIMYKMEGAGEVDRLHLL